MIWMVALSFAADAPMLSKLHIMTKARRKDKVRFIGASFVDMTKLPHRGWGSFVLGENYWMEEKKP